MTAVVVNPVPAEAQSKGGLNESTPVAQRIPNAPSESNLSAGPVRGSHDCYEPASYARTRVMSDAHGNARTFNLIRTDR